MVYFRLRQDADTADFTRKLRGADSEVPVRETSDYDIRRAMFSVENLNFCPITESYELLFKDETQIRQTYIRMFVWIGILVMVIALINYFSLLVSQMMNRSKELALRLVNGSSRRGLFALFATELIMMLFVSGFISFLLMEWAEKMFRTISYVKTAWLPEALAYFVGVLFCSLLVAGCIIAYYSRKSLTVALQNRKVPAGRRMNFQRMSMAFQLLVSLLVLFCFAVLFRQLTYLSQTTDIGFERKERATIEVPEEFIGNFLHDLRAQPYIREACVSVTTLLPQSNYGTTTTMDGQGKSITFDLFVVDETFLRFYNIPLKDSLQSGDEKQCLLTESAARELGGPDLVGQSFGGYTIVGIVPDLYTKAPTIPVKPTQLLIARQEDSSYSKDKVLIHYDERYTEELKRFVVSWFLERKTYATLDIATEVYDSYLASERMLMRVLGVMAGICVLISLFGVYAHVVLACERRRKEIAIRKVNGATAGLIIRSFLKEYFLLLLGASAFAFPLGTIVMQRWLEQYVLRAGLSWWIYAGIFLLLWIFMMLCIGRSVWRAARENPAEVIKSE
jgi:ABC-type lipoprotein release transport system permease subunit